MRFTCVANFSVCTFLLGVTACVGATPNVAAKRIAVSPKGGIDATAASAPDSQDQSAGVAQDPNAANPVDPNGGAGGNAGDPNAGAGGNAGDPNAGDPNLGQPAAPSLRWIVMGDFGLANIAALPQCEVGTQQRSVCSIANERCYSSFSTTCPSGDCRRVFKCVTGQTNSLVWFPLGDGTTLSQAASASPAYGLCSGNSDIAGSSCNVVNERCLSSFCTSGSGNSCERRVFKCLISGVEGKLFYRWMGDKSEAELASVEFCTATKDIAGSSCDTEESKCKSSFFTDAANTKRRLFKCTP
ncbi:MAG: hypothetical protein RL189_529 [Pseudomonadota bacterium]|jgi:hypothetical protein